MHRATVKATGSPPPVDQLDLVNAFVNLINISCSVVPFVSVLAFALRLDPRLDRSLSRHARLFRCLSNEACCRVARADAIGPITVSAC